MVLSTGRRSDGQVGGTVDQMDQASRSKTGTPCVKRFNAHFLQRCEIRPTRGHRGDLAFERVRVRRAMAEAAWLDPAALAASAAHLAAADEAIEFAVDAIWAKRVAEDGSLSCRPGAAPREIRRRLAARAIAALGHEGDAETLRGGELDRLVDALDGGGAATLRGVRASGGAQWRFVRAPARR